ncbi:MAG TPA: Clp protease N-terminal domain-containing protein [Ktedonobacteraceae bacterium]|nr:Clp protease N-terminal domain-containing protein [Ktedonobacteraceae bacterium]
MQSRDRFTRFTERARKVLSLSQEEAQRFQHNYIGTEHLLLGLVREGEGVGAKVLARLGVDLQRVREKVEYIIGRGDRIVLGEIGLTPRAKKVIEYAVDEADRMGHQYIGTEHLLLGLVREGNGIASGVLESMGINLEEIRTMTVTIVSHAEAIRVTVVDASSKEQGIHLYDRKQLLQSLSSFDYPLDDQAYRVLSHAGEEALRLQHPAVGPEHLLLGLIYETVAERIFQELGIHLDQVRNSVKKLFDQGEPRPLGIRGFTLLAKAYLHLAAVEAERLGHTSINAAHILLGLTREETGSIANVLSDLGTSREAVRKQQLDALKGE